MSRCVVRHEASCFAVRSTEQCSLQLSFPSCLKNYCGSLVMCVMICSEVLRGGGIAEGDSEKSHRED